MPDDDWRAELGHERRRGEQACPCGHMRRQPVIGSGAGLDPCTVTVPDPSTSTVPGRHRCPGARFRLDRGQ